MLTEKFQTLDTAANASFNKQACRIEQAEASRDEKEAELFIDKLIEKLQLKKGCKLIDIACGKGRHATYFNKKGMDVVGIDLSKNSLSTAKQSAN